MINYEKNKEQEYVSPACKAFQIKLRSEILNYSRPYDTKDASETDGYQRANEFDW